MTNEKTKPVDRIRVGRVQAAIWRNTNEEGKAFYSFTLDRSYKKEDGNYDSTASFGLADALVVAKIANLVDTRIRKLYDADHAQSQADESYEEDVAA